MQERRYYSRAPIAEAVIDIQAKLPATVTLDMLTQAQAEEQARYPTRRNRMALEAQVLAGPQVGASATQTQLGYVFLSADERRAFQSRLNGFTFNWLAPYKRWEDFRDEARRLWAVYRAIVEPEAITRIGIRYVNSLHLPLPMRDLKDFLRTLPEVSPDLPQSLSGYVMQLQIPQEDLRAMLILNQAMLPPSRPDAVSVLLDIDLFQESAGLLSEDDLWAGFEELHAREDQIFEACITEQTREVIA